MRGWVLAWFVLSVGGYAVINRMLQAPSLQAVLLVGAVAMLFAEVWIASRVRASTLRNVPAAVS